jgi:hypothetical protein
MDIRYRLERDGNFRTLYSLLGPPSNPEETYCANCGRECEEDDMVVVLSDLSHNTPDEWKFCSPRCLLERIELRSRE